MSKTATLLPSVNLAIASYDTFHEYVDTLNEVRWQIVVCDAAHTLKNGSSKVHLACSLTSYQCFFLSRNYRLGHPENYLFLLSKNLFTGSKYPKNKLINFEKINIAHDLISAITQHLTSNWLNILTTTAAFCRSKLSISVFLYRLRAFRICCEVVVTIHR